MNKPLNFTYQAIKNYLYDKHKQFICRFNSILDIYNEFNRERQW